jgi:CRP/FNR family transcriptional regulator, cyclic AMP receptor protein
VDANTLKNVPLFAGLSAQDRELAAQHADVVTVAQGTTLIEEGRRAYEFFVILEGEAEVVEAGTVVASVGAGDVVGEIGVLETTARTASVVAMSAMRLIVMDGRALRALSDTHPDIYNELQRLIAQRLSG